MAATILVVDDDEAARDAAGSALAAAGYAVETAAPDLPLPLPLPDLVLVEPDLACAAAALRDPAQAAHLVLFSARPADELARLAAEQGAAGWIAKTSPLAAGALVRQVRSLLTQVSPGAPPRRALVVDDSRAMRRILRGVLEELGYEVREAAQGLEALALLHELPAEVLLLDLNMPEMNGQEVIRAVRGRLGPAGPRILMVTSETDPDRVAEALHAGADDYLTKPFTPAGVRAKLALLGAGAVA